MTTFLAIAGWLLIAEGLVIFLFPSLAARLTAALISSRPDHWKTIALIEIAVGVGIVWAAQP